MTFKYFIQHGWFITRVRYYLPIARFPRKLYYRMLGMKVGKGTHLPKMYVTWPQQVLLGNNCKMERGVNFKYDGIWKEKPSIIINDNVFIGANCEFNISQLITIGHSAMIASGCKFIDHDHGKKLASDMNTQPLETGAIAIDELVWLGFNVTVLKGVTVGKGAVVAAGAVVNKSIPPFEIWGGVPAKKIGVRQ